MRTVDPSTDDEPIRVPAAPDALALLWLENVGVIAWLTSPTTAVMNGLIELTRQRLAKYPRGISLIHISRTQTSMVDAPTREVAIRWRKELGPALVATAVLTPSEGFLASTLRSIATGVAVIARSPSEMRFHDLGDEVLTWLPDKHEQMTGVEIDRDRLRLLLRRAETLALGHKPRG